MRAFGQERTQSAAAVGYPSLTVHGVARRLTLHVQDQRASRLVAASIAAIQLPASRMRKIYAVHATKTCKFYTRRAPRRHASNMASYEMSTHRISVPNSTSSFQGRPPGPPTGVTDYNVLIHYLSIDMLQRSLNTLPESPTQSPHSRLGCVTALHSCRACANATSTSAIAAHWARSFRLSQACSTLHRRLLPSRHPFYFSSLHLCHSPPRHPPRPLWAY